MFPDAQFLMNCGDATVEECYVQASTVVDGTIGRALHPNCEMLSEYAGIHPSHSYGIPHRLTIGSCIDK